MSIPTFLCFVQFIVSLVNIIKTRQFNYEVVVQLLSSLDGFEAVVLCAIMLALKEKKN